MRICIRIPTLLCAVLLAVAAITFSPVASAQTDTWNAGTGNWSNAGNWSSGVPISTSNVVVPVPAPLPFTAVISLDVNATIASLDMQSASAQLNLPGDSILNQTAARSLTISGATSLAFPGDQLNIGAGSSVTMNGAATNEGTITLSSVTLQANTAPILASLNGTGTITNDGTIQGLNNSTGPSGGNIGLDITNSSTGELNGALTLNGVTITGGSYGADPSLQNVIVSNSATFAGVEFGGPAGSPHPSTVTVNLAGGSALTLQGSNTNVGEILLGTGNSGATISGPGSIDNIGTIAGVGTISANILNPGVISSYGSLVLQGQVQAAGGPSFSEILLSAGTNTVFDGAQIIGGNITGQGGTLSAQNGAVAGGVTFEGASPVVLTGGSSLGINGLATVAGTLQLGAGAQGANLTDALGGGSELDLSAGTTLQGGGIVGVAIQNNGGTIIANNPGAPLVLQGNVTGGSIAVTAGSTLTLGSIGVSPGSFSLAAGATLNGTGVITMPVHQSFANSGTIAPGTAGAPGQISIQTPFYEQTIGAQFDILLAGTALGDFSQLNIVDTLGNGTTIGAQFDSGSVFDVTLGSSFDPSVGCTSTTMALCESFNVFNMDEALISGFGNITFSLPTLPTGFSWAEVVSSLGGVDQEIVLQIFGEASSSGGGGGGGGGTTTPEPQSLCLLGGGLIAVGLALRKKPSQRVPRA